MLGSSFIKFFQADTLDIVHVMCSEDFFRLPRPQALARKTRQEGDREGLESARGPRYLEGLSATLPLGVPPEPLTTLAHLI